MTNKSLWIILIIIVLIALGISVYAWRVLRVERVEDETADWKSYTNVQMGYTINYPKDWNVQKEGEPPYPGPPRGVSFSIRAGGMETVENPSNYCLIGVSVSTYDNQSEMVDLENKGYAKSSVNVAGISATRFSKDHPGIADAVYFSRNEKHYRISRNRGFGTKYESEYKQIFNQILSTFKFLE